MSRSDARSRRLRRRPSRTVPAAIVAAILLTLGVLTAIAAIARLVNGTWPTQVTGPATAIGALRWGSDAVLAAAIATAAIGLVLLVAGVKLGGHNSATLRSPSSADPDGPEHIEFVISNQAMARLAAGQADLVDGVDKVSVSATGRNVRLRITTTSEQSTQIRDRAVRGVTGILTAAGVHPLPRVSATVHTKEV